MTRDETLECSNCSDGIDPRQDTHYRVGEEERPIPQLEKETDDLEPDDFFSRGWFLCRSCTSEVIDLD